MGFKMDEEVNKTLSSGADGFCTDVEGRNSGRQGIHGRSDRRMPIAHLLDSENIHAWLERNDWSTETTSGVLHLTCTLRTGSSRNVTLIKSVYESTRDETSRKADKP
jgi:hypothetical protein